MKFTRFLLVIFSFFVSYCSFSQIGTLQTNGIYDRQGQGIIGTLYNKGSFVTGDLNDWRNNGGGTPTISGTSISISAVSNGLLNETLDLSKISFNDLWYWCFTTYHHINYSAGSSTYGNGPGFRSYLGTNTASVEAHLVTSTTTGGQGHLMIQTNYPSPTLLVSSTDTLGFNNGDQIMTSLERRGTKLFATAINITTNSRPIYAFYEYNMGIGASTIPPNAGMFGIFELGGNALIDSVHLYSREISNPFLLTGTDSKTVNFNDSTKNGWVNQLRRTYPSIVNFAGGGNTTALFDSCMPFILNYIKPHNILIETGTNDGTWSVTKLPLADIYNKCIAAGINFNIMKFYQNGNSAVKDSIKANYPNNYINAYDVTKFYKALTTDSVHLSGFGDSLIAKVVLQSGRLIGNAQAYDFLLDYAGSPPTPATDTSVLAHRGTPNIFTSTNEFDNTLTLKIAQNAQTKFLVVNSQAGTSSQAIISLQSDNSAGTANMGKNSSSLTRYKFLGPSDIYLQNGGGTGGNISILNDFTGGEIYMGSGSSTKPQFTLHSNGHYSIGGDSTDQASTTFNLYGQLWQKKDSITYNGTPPASWISIYYDTINQVYTRGPVPSGGGGGGISGLTTNTIPKASSSTTIANSSITDNGTTITLGEKVTYNGALAATSTPTILAHQTDSTISQLTIGTGLSTSSGSLIAQGQNPYSGTPSSASTGTNVTSCTLSGNDNHFKITLVTSAAVAGTLATINFANTWSSTPFAVISCADTNTGTAIFQGGGTYISLNANNTTQCVLTGNIGSAGTYTFNVHVGN